MRLVCQRQKVMVELISQQRDCPTLLEFESEGQDNLSLRCGLMVACGSSNEVMSKMSL